MSESAPEFDHLIYERRGRVATITLNRPDRFNAIARGMPREIAAAVDHANYDHEAHVIVLQGAGKGFCGGYDLTDFAERRSSNDPGAQAVDAQGQPWDPLVDFDMMFANTQDFMSLWRSNKPTIAKVHGAAVAGGSDIALACDMVVMAEDARIGYPPARVWGCPTTAIWVYRLGPEKAKRMLLTGDLITGRQAVDMGLVLEAVSADQLDDRVEELAQRMTGVPRNQLMMQKMMINQAYANMGLETTQMVATLMDGVARHSAEGMWFKKRAEDVGFKQAINERDGGNPIAPGVSQNPYKF